ncbi:MAG: hypothetical protein HUJ72_02350 [Blautia sp.]|nr:hypothetical protein [Blautia sp.]
MKCSYFKRLTAILLMTALLLGMCTSASAATTTLSKKLWGTKVTMCGEQTTNYMIERICQKVLKKDMTQLEKIKRLYEYVTKFSTHYSSKKQVGKINFKLGSSQTQKDIKNYNSYLISKKKQGKVKFVDDLYQFYIMYFFQTGDGDCLDTATAFKFMMDHIGVPCKIINGTSPGGNHYWNIVKYNGKWYFVDCDAENDNYTRLVKKNGKLSYAFFMKGTTQMKNYGFGFSKLPVSVSKSNLKVK